MKRTGNWKAALSLLLCLALIWALAGCGVAGTLPSVTQPEAGTDKASGEPAGSTENPGGEGEELSFPALSYAFVQGVTKVSYEDGKLRVRSDAGAAELAVKANMLSGEGLSQDGTRAYPELYDEGNYRYFCFADGRLTEITDWGFYHACSRDGRVAISRVGTEARIVVYRDGKPVQTIDDSGVDFVMSPDGSAAMWCSYRDSDLHPTTRLWVNGEITDLGEDLTPVAVADNAAYVYFRMGSGSGLYVQRGTDKDSVNKVQPRWVDYLVVFNADYSEVIAAGEDCSYWSVRGGKGVEVPRDAVQVILPEGALSGPAGTSGSGHRCLGLSTFQGSLFVEYNGDDYNICQLLWLNGKPVAAVVDNAEWDDPKLSGDGSVLVYRKDGGLCRAVANSLGQWTGTEVQPPVQIVTGLRNKPFFNVSADGSTVFYRAEDGLKAWSGGETRLVSEKANSCEILGSTALFYEGSELWAESDGERYEPLPGVAAQRIVGKTPELVLIQDNQWGLYVLTEETLSD